MVREPLSLYIFRYIVGFGILFFMAMIYWSSLLVEEDLKQVINQLEDVKKELSDTKAEVAFRKNHQVNGLEEHHQGSSPAKIVKRDQIDAKLPNLLHPDPFYEKVLPQLLPKNFKPAGTRQIDGIGKPDTLHPFLNLAPYSNFIDQCQLQLATLEIGKYETMAPSLAIKMEERQAKDGKGIEYWIHLRDQVYWQPLNKKHFPADFKLADSFFESHQVTAYDVKFYVDAILNPFVQEAGAVALRNYYSDIEEIRVVDDLTLVVRWKAQQISGPEGEPLSKVKYAAKWLTGSLKPLARFVYQYFSDGKKIIEEDDSDVMTYRNNSVWAQQFSKHWARQIIVGCGPWMFDGMTDKLMRFVRNPMHYNPLEVLVEAMEVQFKDSPEAVWLDFKSVQTDTYILNPSKQLELKNYLASDEYKAQKDKNGLKVNQLEYLDRVYFYIGWNQAVPFFKSRSVRQAMTMAIDIRRMITQNLNGMAVPTTGTFALDSSAYDLTLAAWPYDPDESKRLLEEDGWYDSDGDGIRDKVIDGQKISFSFYLSYFVKSPIMKINCEYIAAALKEIGVNCQLKGLDTADLMHDFDNKEFDAIYFGWALGTPPEEPKQLWHSSGAKEKGSSNAVGFANPEIDKIIEELVYEDQPEKRKSLYHRFNQIIYDEQPYTFLYVPKNLLLYRDYIKNLFIPTERQDLIPGANMSQPDLNIIWLDPPYHN